MHFFKIHFLKKVLQKTLCFKNKIKNKQNKSFFLFLLFLRAFPKSAMETLIALVVTTNQNKKRLSRVSLDSINYFFLLRESFVYCGCDSNIYAITADDKSSEIHRLRGLCKFKPKKLSFIRVFIDSNTVIEIGDALICWINVETAESVALSRFDGCEIYCAHFINTFVMIDHYRVDTYMTKIQVIDFKAFPNFVINDLLVPVNVDLGFFKWLTRDGKYIVLCQYNQFVMLDLHDPSKHKVIDLDYLTSKGIEAALALPLNVRPYTVFELLAISDDSECIVCLERQSQVCFFDLANMDRKILMCKDTSMFQLNGFGSAHISKSKNIIIYFYEELDTKTYKMAVYDLKKDTTIHITIDKGVRETVGQSVYVNDTDDVVYFEANLKLHCCRFRISMSVEKIFSLPLPLGVMHHSYVSTLDTERITEKEKQKLSKKYLRL